MSASRTGRWCAAWAACCAVAGTAALAAAVAATAAGYGYVSEAGAPGAPLRPVYRLGIFTVALGLALLAVALRPMVRAATLALAAAAPFAVASGAVSCTPGCPLPPYERPGETDLLHAAASTGALLFSAAAMLLIAAEPAVSDRLRRVSRVGAGLTVPLLGAAGLAMLLAGRGYVSGLLERAALVTALGWLAVAAIAAMTPPPET